MQSNSLFLSDNKDIEAVFGENATFYINLSKQTCPSVLKARYYFENFEIFEMKSKNGQYKTQDINKIYWREILFRAHISIVSSQIRTCRLIDATAREYAAKNLPGWASCARALIESVGDSIDTLQYIPHAISENYHSINRCILGREDRNIYGAKELEDKLIEFIYARRITHEEKEGIPKSHIAKPSSFYIKTLEKFEIENIRSIYRSLCEFSHPASASVQYMFIPEGDDSQINFRISDNNDSVVLNMLLDKYKSSFSDLIMVIFNSIFISLCLFDNFKLFPHIPALLEVNFSNIPLWSKVQKNLSNSYQK